ncbi:MAG: Gfo/Idh/MocA family oxidoreductase [Candidatus Limiplasma sp.]|nr:Gfo/Idh/MocA family oxidoreductase [Candidatus Limiplasma sp.]
MKMKFGIIGTGSIAMKFAVACAMTEEAEAYAVSSRSLEKARAFAGAHGVRKAYEGAQEMVRDTEIDCIYVATPHPLHFENCLLALNHGKSVLCEKPMVMNRREAETLFALAKEKGLFLMEGMWSRFLPNTQRVMGWLAAGEIGDVKFIDMQFSFSVDMENPKPRLVLPEFGGGSMYDLGVYTVEMASWYAGANPEAYEGYCTDFMPNSDGTAVMALRYPGGILATMRTGIACEAPCRATILGTKGRIEIDKFYLAQEVRLLREESLVEKCAADYDVPEGLTWQLKAVCGYLRDGVGESGVVPARDTIATAEVLGTMMKRFYPDYYGNN